jgi:hypothetical protein
MGAPGSGVAGPTGTAGSTGATGSPAAEAPVGAATAAHNLRMRSVS